MLEEGFLPGHCLSKADHHQPRHSGMKLRPAIDEEGFGRDGQLMPTDANVSSAQELKIGSTHRKWFRLIQPLRANWSLWELGKLNFTSACSGES